MKDALRLDEMLALFVGKKLGEGISRSVYVNKIDPTTVIKFENNMETHQNVLEWETWRYLQWAPQGKWLAPCVAISPCGRILIQKRADPLPAKYKLPARMPEFLTDLKRSNLGLIGRRLVSTDYGYTVSNYSNKLRKMYWDRDET